MKTRHKPVASCEKIKQNQRNMKACFRRLHKWECHFSKWSPAPTTAVPAAGQEYCFAFHKWENGSKVNDGTFYQPSSPAPCPLLQLARYLGAPEQRLSLTGLS